MIKVVVVMNRNEVQMVELLIDLRENYHFLSVKAEFEHEGARLEEIQRLREITLRAGLGITLKIGGCEAVTDLRMSRDIGVETIVAPMVESPFAMKKFIQAVDEVYGSDELERGHLHLHINVESVQGAQNFPQMVEQPEFARLSGVTVGRGDLAESLGLARSEIDSEQVFECCSGIFSATKAAYPEMECIMGAINGNGSFAFIERFPPGLVDGYERRKAMFDTLEGWERRRTEGLYKGILFEKLWCENRAAYYGRLSESDAVYLKLVEKSLAQLESVL